MNTIYISIQDRFTFYNSFPYTGLLKKDENSVIRNKIYFIRMITSKSKFVSLFFNNFKGINLVFLRTVYLNNFRKMIRTKVFWKIFQPLYILDFCLQINSIGN